MGFYYVAPEAQLFRNLIYSKQLNSILDSQCLGLVVKKIALMQVLVRTKIRIICAKVEDCYSLRFSFSATQGNLRAREPNLKHLTKQE